MPVVRNAAYILKECTLSQETVTGTVTDIKNTTESDIDIYTNIVSVHRTHRLN